MALVVQKYGGSSVADAESIKRVAQPDRRDRKARATRSSSSCRRWATPPTTCSTSPAGSARPPAARELDMLLTAGERISMALLAMAIHDLGVEARSFTGSQAGMITDSPHGRARIVDVTPGRIREALDEGAIAIVAGFQGVNRDTKDITTLGRGGSDTTAVALAAALERRRLRDLHRRRRHLHRRPARRARRPARSTASPARRCSSSRRPARRCCTCAASSTPAATTCRCTCGPRSQRTRHARASSTDTVLDVRARPADPTSTTEETPWRSRSSPGSRTDLGEAKITVVGVPDKPGKAAEIFKTVADAEDQHRHDRAERVGRGHRPHRHLVHLPEGRRPDALRGARAASRPSVGFETLQYDDQIGKLALVGAGMRTAPGRLGDAVRGARPTPASTSR